MSNLLYSSLKLKNYNASKSNTASAVITTGKEMQVENDGIVIFPNPNGGTFTLQIANERMNELRIINILGEIVYNSPLTSYFLPFTSYLLPKTIDLSHQPAGIYNIQIIGDGVLLNKKVTVE